MLCPETYRAYIDQVNPALPIHSGCIAGALICFRPTYLIKAITVTIGIVLADPCPVTLDGLMNIFQNDPEYEVKTCVHDGEAAMNAVTKLKPDILLLELSLPKKDGLSLIRDMQNQQMATQPVVFTDAALAQVMQAIDLGVQGLVSKDKGREFLTRCIKSVYDGGKWLDEDLAMKAVSHLIERQKNNDAIAKILSVREIAVAKLVAEGLPNKSIARRLFISEGTVKLHLHHIYQKLNCSGRMTLVLKMQKNGMA